MYLSVHVCTHVFLCIQAYSVLRSTCVPCVGPESGSVCENSGGGYSTGEVAVLEVTGHPAIPGVLAVVASHRVTCCPVSCFNPPISGRDPYRFQKPSTHSSHLQELGVVEEGGRRDDGSPEGAGRRTQGAHSTADSGLPSAHGLRHWHEVAALSGGRSRPTRFLEFFLPEARVITCMRGFGVGLCLPSRVCGGGGQTVLHECGDSRGAKGSPQAQPRRGPGIPTPRGQAD